MKIFLAKVIIAAVIAAFVWAGFSSYYALKHDNFGYVSEIESGVITRLFADDKNFIWQGALPNLYRVRVIDGVYYFRHNIILSIPPITDLQDERYSIIIPVSVRIKAVPGKIHNLQQLADSGDKIIRFTESELERIYANVYGDYLTDTYRREILIARAAENLQMVRDDLETRLDPAGFKLIDFVQDRIYFPSYKVYNEGIVYQDEYRNVKMLSEREMIKLKSELERERIVNKERFDYLGRISQMIAENPDLLKYIYIDSMADNVKVVISSDRELVPDMFISEKKEK